MLPVVVRDVVAFFFIACAPSAAQTGKENVGISRPPKFGGAHALLGRQAVLAFIGCRARRDASCGKRMRPIECADKRRRSRASDGIKRRRSRVSGGIKRAARISDAAFSGLGG